MVQLVNLIILSLLALLAHSDKQTVLVSFHYEDSDNFSSSQTIKLSGDLQGRTYWIRMAHFKEGDVCYKILNERPFVAKDTVFSIHIAAEPLHAHEVDFSIKIGENSIVEKAKVDDVLHSILLETYPAGSYFSNDTIPLTGYSSGALREVLIEGEIKKAGSYCDVRDAKIPPKKWHEAFNMKEYIWFDLYFE